MPSLIGSRFWEHFRDILNPDTPRGAAPWVYYSIYAFFVFVFNIFDIVSKKFQPSYALNFYVHINLMQYLTVPIYYVVQANMPKEIADYLNKMGARIPNIKPGKGTIEYLTKIQASTRFWGRLPFLEFSVYVIRLFLCVYSTYILLWELLCRWFITKCSGNYIDYFRS